MSRRAPCFVLPCTPEDVMRHALAAYYRATAEAVAPQGDPDPASWSDPENFMQTLCDLFVLRLRCEAQAAGHPVAADPARLARWLETPPARDQHIRDVDPGLWAELERQRTGAGRSPASAEGALMAQGCAAVETAVGPAPTRGWGGAAARSGGPLFSDPKGQTLPAGRPVNEAEAAQEAAWT